MVQQPFTVLGERGRVERLGVDGQIQEPFEQQVVVEAFAERSLASDRIQRHQHRRLQQRLGRHARSDRRGVHGIEVAIELAEHHIDDLADPPDRMIRRIGSSGLNELNITNCRSDDPRITRACRTRPPIASIYEGFFSTLLAVRKATAR